MILDSDIITKSWKKFYKDTKLINSIENILIENIMSTP